jgi:hypothetical protein
MAAALRNRDATVIIKSFDANGDMVDISTTFGSLEPSVQLLEFEFIQEAQYPHIVSIEMSIVYADKGRV